MESVVLEELKREFKPRPYKIFTGIGPRDIDETNFLRIYDVSYQMTKNGYYLRSGGARGCDASFELGNREANDNQREIFIPWNKFQQDHTNPCSKVYYHDNKNVFMYNREYDQILNRLVSDFHPRYNHLTRGPMALMKRNCHQILGLNLDTPTELVITDGKVKFDSNNLICDCEGGTGFAVRLAYALKIPIYNLSTEDHRKLLTEQYNINFKETYK